MTRKGNDEAFNENRRQKRLVHPPCTTTVINAAGKEVTEYPAVLCNFECDTCGWNPAVKKQRVDRMLTELSAKRAKAQKKSRKKGGS